MPSRLLALLATAVLALAACDAPPPGSVPLDQRHPLSEEYHLAPVLADGTISPDWGGSHYADATPLPDALAFPETTATAWLGAVETAIAEGGPDTLRANVWVRVVGFHLCPPCPRDLQCEPCGPSTVVALDETASGQAVVRFEIGPEHSLDGFAAGRMGVASLEAVRYETSATVRALGFSERARDAPPSPTGATLPDPR